MNIRKDLYSKIMDGLFTGLLLVLVELFIALCIPVVRVVFGRPGLLVSAIVLMAGGVILLERSLASRYSNETRARFGLAGGLVTWGAIELSHLIGEQPVTSETGTLVFMLIILINVVLWRRFFPTGLRFFQGIVISNWGASLLIAGLRFILTSNAINAQTFNLIGFSALAVAVLSILWILLGSKTATQRLWAALVFFQMLVFAAYIFRGGLI